MAFILISGSNGSGKSLFAEQLISKMPGKRCYIATMKVQTEDNIKRIEKHRKQRQHLNFETLELPYEVASAPIDNQTVVLLEDVSNLFANAFFEKSGSVDSVFADILRLKKHCNTLVAVTISGLQNEGYDAETATYINNLNSLNQRLFFAADIAYTMENGQPVCQKGDAYAKS
ncbi:MAG: bifunctional adenosylcobinamide kinase/adenosylcobinamide-phosphate guanylyltransferase [Ruminococcaceae bacterium]|nr:bifunctional adenosylcobinamide kinase/adenosylcobinamide-phosphate guanylyltransferase [Oscillospiraceae bacterium]